MEILELVQAKLLKLGIPYDRTEVLITLEEIDQRIKNFCHIDKIPNDLFFVRGNMVVDYIRYLTASEPCEAGQLDTSCTQKVGPLTLVSAGDVTYQFGSVQASKTNIANAHAVDLDTFILNYENQLIPFRRLVW